VRRRVRQPWAGRAALRGRPLEHLLSVCSPTLLLVGWELAARSGSIDARLFPAPTSIFAALRQMTLSGELWVHLSVSLGRLMIGFVLGAVPGVAVGIAMGLFGPIRAVIQPIVDATFPIPKIAVLPIFIMVFGTGEASKYAIIATAVVYLVLINTVSGVRNLDRIYLDVGKNFHASTWMMFTDVALPGALPFILTGLKLGMGVALLVIVSAEFVGARSGIGYLIWSSWQIFEVEKMYVGLLMIAIIGFGAATAFNVIEHALVPWKAR
jgi:ABC-type nitrate/sulfonate/bicarbonate transport system permease component